MKYLISICILLSLYSCKQAENTDQIAQTKLNKTLETIIFSGDSLFSPDLKSGLALENYKLAKTAYLRNPNNVDSLIWLARRTAYLGYFQEAIKIYSIGIKQFPQDARLYRHRGHRYISIREYDLAITDFEKAVKLIEGTQDRVETDGLPNAKNIPLSTLHGNIWYHLGLAYYLKNDMENSLKAFENRSVLQKFDDNIVSGSQWLYMINRRMKNTDFAKGILKAINKDMDIIENMSYHQMCLFYKGELTEDQLKMDDVAIYSLANWELYHNQDTAAAKAYYQRLLIHGNKYSFAYIAGESDWKRLYVTKSTH